MHNEWVSRRSRSSSSSLRVPSAERTARGMELGQHAIVAVLLVIGAVRALGDGTAPLPVIASGALFLVWYALVPALPARAGRDLTPGPGWLLGLTACWVLATVVSVEFVWLAFALWLLAGQLLPLRWAVGYSVAVYAVVAIRPVVATGTVGYANLIGPLIGGVFAFGISLGYLRLVRDAEERSQLITSLVAAQRETQALQDELALSQHRSGEIAERTRLSREIHDTIAQGLSSIVFLAHPGDDPERALERIGTVAREHLAETRRIIAGLSPSALEQRALPEALERLLNEMATETGISVSLDADDSLPLLPTPVEVVLLRTAQTALANVAQHAGAGRVAVSLVDGENGVRLDVVDDGAGFPIETGGPPAGSTRVEHRGFGLSGARDRLRELGGTLTVESAPGQGTQVSAFVPLAPPPQHSKQATEEASP